MISTRAWLTVMFLSFASIALGNNTSVHKIAGGGSGGQASLGEAAAAHGDGLGGAVGIRPGVLGSGALKGATVSQTTIAGRPATVVHVTQGPPLTDEERRRLVQAGFFETHTGQTVFYCSREPPRDPRAPRDQMRCLEFPNQ